MNYRDEYYDNYDMYEEGSQEPMTGEPSQNVKRKVSIYRNINRRRRYYYNH